MRPIENIFAARAWKPFAFQRRVWAAYENGHSGLLHAPTGMGKTLAAFGALLPPAGSPASEQTGLQVLWLTPMRALAADTQRSLLDIVQAAGLNWRIELRTGDTGSAQRQRQREKPPEVLITTPESLSVMLSYPHTAGQLGSLKAVIVDELHELLGTKRGVMTELCLARLRALCPALWTWGLSATLMDSDKPLAALLGTGPARFSAVAVRATGKEAQKHYNFEVLIPEQIERFPWAGHLGIRMLLPVIDRIERAESTLVFTNTRSQSEIWFQSILKARPDLIGKVAIHHGSLDRDLRQRVEEMIKAGQLKAVVCTSSLDLGVDFPPVDQVIQIGSPKGIARLMQRAGRSGHQPGRQSSVLCVPTNALELIEFAAARDAMAAKAIEPRIPLELSLDVLCQHILTVACGAGPDGLDADNLRAEVQSTASFATLTEQQWQWAMDFAIQGGKALTAYGRYARLVERILPDGTLRYTVASQPIVKMHRLAIGTITSDPSMKVQTRSGALLGTIEEGFIAKLPAGSVFVFSGRRLRLLQVRQNAAIVEQVTTGRSGMVPSWAGTRMPLSHELAEAVKVKLRQADAGSFLGPEMQAARPLLELQRTWSALPKPGELVVERIRTREGFHTFIYPLEGRLVHEGLAALCAHRIAQATPISFSMSANDYGFELLSATDPRIDETLLRRILSTERLAEDLLGCINTSELARRQFREIARIAGLIVPSFPGQPRSARQLQASSELFFDVFLQYDPENMLLDQARREVMQRQLEFSRLESTLRSLASATLLIVDPHKLTPLAFPLWVDRLRAELTSEKLEDRLQRMLTHLEQQAPAGPGSDTLSAAVGPSTEPTFADEPPQALPALPSLRRRRGRPGISPAPASAKVPWRRPRLQPPPGKEPAELPHPDPPRVSCPQVMEDLPTEANAKFDAAALTTTPVDLSDPRLDDYRVIKDRQLTAEFHRSSLPPPESPTSPHPSITPPGQSPSNLITPSKFMAEGELVVAHLIDSHYPTLSVLCADNRLASMHAPLQRLRQAHPTTPIFTLPKSKIESLVGFSMHRGVMAIGQRLAEDDPHSILQRCLPGRPLLILEDICNHDNIGAAFRNAAAFGAGGILLSPRCTDPLYRKALRVSMGHILRVPWAYLPAWPQWHPIIQAQGIRTLAMTPRGDSELRHLAATLQNERVAILIGSEGPGLTTETISTASYRTKIPMAPGTDSLNAAVASAVALYELSSPAAEALPHADS